VARCGERGGFADDSRDGIAISSRFFGWRTPCEDGRSMTRPAPANANLTIGAKKDEDPVAKKASTKRNGRPHATTRDTKPKRGGTASAHAKSPATTHHARHGHPADSMVTAFTDTATAIGDGAARAKKLAGRAKADASSALTDVSNALTVVAPSFLGRIVGLMAGIVDALLPKRLPFRKHAHSH
jgi:hypothetical protein